jgi:hypothetical protein
MLERWLRLALVLGAIGVAIWAWTLFNGPRQAVDLLQALQTAEKRANPLPVDQAFATTEVTIGGETKRSLLQQSDSRVIYRLVLPPDAAFSAAVAIDPAVWSAEGDGALFRVGVSDGRTYEELLALAVDPVHSPADRRWIPVSLDLSFWSGRQVDLILNVNASAKGQAPDARNDRALWGAPVVTSGR